MGPPGKGRGSRGVSNSMFPSSRSPFPHGMVSPSRDDCRLRSSLVVLGERWARGRAGEPMAGSRGRGLEEKWDALELTEDSGENLPSVPPPRDPAMTRIAPLEAPTTIANWPVSLCLQPARLGWDVPDSGDGQAGFAEPFPGSSVVESGPPLPLFIIPKLDSARLQLHVPPPP